MFLALTSFISIEILHCEIFDYSKKTIAIAFVLFSDILNNNA